MPKAPKSTSTKTEKFNQQPYPVTPDGHYFIVRGRCWRCTNPSLSTEERERYTKELMNARRGMRKDQAEERRSEAKVQVDRAKVALGERGPVWWNEREVCDRKMVWNTGYKEWWERLQAESGSGVTGEQQGMRGEREDENHE